MGKRAKPEEIIAKQREVEVRLNQGVSIASGGVSEEDQKLIRGINFRTNLKVPQKQPKRGRLWLNDGSCVR
ncbi:MAG: hypothetical protein AAF950_14125, partial [Pseudomonadota bacterium]